MNTSAQRVMLILIAGLLGAIAGIVGGLLEANLGGAHASEHGVLYGFGAFMACSLFVLAVMKYIGFFDSELKLSDARAASHVQMDS
jgi:hypothetical protein